MKRKKLYFSIAAVAALGIAATGIVLAQVGPGFGPFGAHHGERIGAFLADYLDLTPAQQAQTKALFETTRTANAASVAQLKQLAEQARVAVKTGKSDAELQQIANGIGPLVSQIAGNHLKALSRFYASLTQPQKDKADRLHDRIHSRMEQRMNGDPPAFH